MPDPVHPVASGRQFRPSEPGTDHSGTVRVRDALLLDAMRAGAPEVLAGHASLDRPIRWVHSGELTTIADSLLGGELLLTTGLAIPPDAAGTRRYVAELAGRAVAALCIELGGAYSAVPDVLIEDAERYAVPLIVFHEPVRFVTITEQIHTLLIDKRFAVLRDVQAAEDELLAIAAGGGRAQDMLAALAAILNNPVAIVTSAGVPLVAANPRRLDRDARANWPELTPRSRTVWVESALPTSARTPAGSSLVAIADGAVLPPLTAALLQRAGQIVTLVASAIPVSHDRVAQDRAHLMESLVRGAPPMSRTISRLRALEFDVAAPRIVPFAVAEAQGEFHEDDEWVRCARSLMAAWRRSGTLLVAHRPSGGLRGLLSVRSEQERIDSASELTRLVRSVLGDGASPTIVIAQPVTVERLGAELSVADQSTASVPLSNAGETESGWIDTRALESARFRWSVRGHAETRQFVGRVLAPFLGPDSAAHAPLVETLRILCDTLGQKAEAARLLHLNRQSLYARIARIEDLVGAPLDVPETIATFRLALQLADAQGVRLSG